MKASASQNHCAFAFFKGATRCRDVFMSAPIHALVFDAYGTLFDPLSIRTRAEEFFPGRGDQLCQLWRAKQLEYSWLRTLMQRYKDFWTITADALAFACLATRISCSAQQRDALLDGYLRLQTFAEVKGALRGLSAHRLAILSNGTPQMLRSVVEFNGLASLFESVLSVDSLRLFKPHPSVYKLAVDQLRLPNESIGFVSSNFWDIAGASSFGFQTFWLNRGQSPADELGFTPTQSVKTLNDL
jgi:2-haloacid dehalogenase